MAYVQPLAGNPFALMLHPEDVLKAVEGSDRLGGLQRRVYRPLDRPLIPKAGQGGEMEDFDQAVDNAADEPADAFSSESCQD